MYYIYIVKYIVLLVFLGFLIAYLTFWLIEILMMLFSSFSKERMYAPTRLYVLIHLIKELKNLRKDGIVNGQCSFLEIGSGNGRVIRFLSKIFKDCDFIGVEISWGLYFWSKILNCILVPFRRNLKIVHADALKMDLSKYDVFYLFSQGQFLKKFVKQAVPKMKAKVIIFSWMFEIPDANNFGLKLIKQISISGITGKNHLYVYQKL